MVRVGAACAGIGGLELAASALFDTEVQWVAEVDPAASKVLDVRFGVPNLGDLTEITDPPPIDLLTAGFPCQPVSSAGKRQGVHDERWLIRDVMGLARRSGARWVLLENVRGLLTANQGEALRQVLVALADHGYDAWWTCVRASDVGAPHRRERWFCLAADADSGTGQEQHVGPQARLAAQQRRDVAGRGVSDGTRDAATADADLQGLEGPQPAQRCDLSTRGGGSSPADAEVVGCERSRPARDGGSGSADGDLGVGWGPYADAIRRWEYCMGTAAPVPVDGKQLSPRFVEWLMGYPTGWVTDLELTRSQMLKMLGNAVVPQQGAYAIAELLRLAGGGLPDQQPADDVRLLPTPRAALWKVANTNLRNITDRKRSNLEEVIGPLMSGEVQP